MRIIEVPEKADILVSELLGSFGDNELSPECLDGAMRFLKRVSGWMSLCHSFAYQILFCSDWNIYTIVLHRAPRSTFFLKTIQ